MSPLLTTTMEEQKRVIKRIKDEGLPFKKRLPGNHRRDLSEHLDCT